MKWTTTPQFFTALIAAGLSALSVHAEMSTANPNHATPTPMIISKMQEQKTQNPTDADNSAKNRHDNSPSALSPFDQSNQPEALRVTAAIREALVSHPTLSIYAKNIKVITTTDRTVTLRGVVSSQRERDQVEALVADKSAGYVLRNDLQVK